MKILRALPVLALAAVLAAGCSDADQGPEIDAITLDDLTGSWAATSHVFTNKANTGQSFDLIANGGSTDITVLSGGRVRTWVNIGDFSDEWDAQFTISGNTLTSTPAEASRGMSEYTFTLVDGVLTLMDDDESFDFTLSGASEIPATMKVVFVRK
ncbi:MAG TPA: hypothetical protein VLA36_07510 [Longimicrobiales bacterium]|nr:hypothetical protein [Longimicrobiales bacterium]